MWVNALITLADAEAAPAVAARLRKAARFCNDPEFLKQHFAKFPLTGKESSIKSRFAKDLADQLRASNVTEEGSPDDMMCVAFGVLEEKYKPTNDPAVAAYRDMLGNYFKKIVRLRAILWPEALNEDERRAEMDYIDLPTLGQQLEDIKHGMYFRCYDLTASFFQVGLEPGCRSIFGFQDAEGGFHRYKVLPMGFYGACEVMQAIHEALVSIAKNRVIGGRTVSSKVYIDNVRFAHKNTALLDEVGDCYVQVCREINVTLNVEPVNQTHQAGEFCGITYNTSCAPACVSLPQGQLNKLHRDMALLHHPDCSVREFLRVIGRLRYCSRVLHLDLSFAYHILKFARRVSRDLALGQRHLTDPVRLWASTRQVIAHWHMHLASNPPTPVLHKLPPRFFLATDASKWGYGAVLIDRNSGRVYHFGRRWSGLYAARHINELEVMAVHLSIEHFADILQGAQIAVYVDNESARLCMSTGHSRGFFLNRRVYEAGLYVRNLPMLIHRVTTGDNPSDEPSRDIPPSPEKIRRWAVSIGLGDLFEPNCVAMIGRVADCESVSQSLTVDVPNVSKALFVSKTKPFVSHHFV